MVALLVQYTALVANLACKYERRYFALRIDARNRIVAKMRSMHQLVILIEFSHV